MSKQQITEWAQQVLERGCLILDTETTGLEDDREIVQIAIITAHGSNYAVLLDTLVRPVNLIPADATRIHGITDAMVADAPGWASLHDQVIDLITNQYLIIYNASYDMKLLRSASNWAGKPSQYWYNYPHLVECAMLQYAEYRQIWNDYRGSWKWHTLTNACAYESIEVPEAPAHSALGDCLRTLALLRKMAGAT